MFGYKVRSSEMAEVALKLEQSGTFIGSDVAEVPAHKDDRFDGFLPDLPDVEIFREGVDGTG